ncbi:protein of unknown function [Stenotrophomonas maltophilia]|nr:protein of unknown function [Stenotrophomonas maltophilia]
MGLQNEAFRNYSTFHVKCLSG